MNRPLSRITMCAAAPLACMAPQDGNAREPTAAQQIVRTGRQASTIGAELTHEWGVPEVLCRAVGISCSRGLSAPLFAA